MLLLRVDLQKLLFLRPQFVRRRCLLLLDHVVCHSRCTGRNGRSLAPGRPTRIVELILAVFDRFGLPGRGARRRRVRHDDVLVRPVHFEYIAGLLRYLAIGTTGRLARVEGAPATGRRDRVKRAGFRDFLRIGRAARVPPTLRPE